MIILPEDIRVFVENIQERVEKEFDVYIGGGYLRDKLNDKPVKDLDLFFVPKEGFEGREVSYTPAKTYTMYNKRVNDLLSNSDMKERGVQQVIGLFCSSLSTVDVQFIVYQKNMTIEELAEDYDFNVNQVVWSPTNPVYNQGLYFTKAYWDGHKDFTLECLKEYGEERMYVRWQRMKSKFPDYECIDEPSFENIDRDALDAKERSGSFCEEVE